MGLRGILSVLLVLPAPFAFGQSASPFASGVWSGNVTTSSASVAVRLRAPDQAARLHVSTAADLRDAVLSPAAPTTSATGNTVTLTVQGLRPDTDYHYGVEVGGVLRPETESRGRFRTFPAGRGTFKIAFASCSDFRKPDQSAFQAILDQRPLLFIHTGDLHYIDTDSTNPDDYRRNYDAVLNQPIQSALYRGVPVAYMWDDHDFCGEASFASAVGNATARAVYRERVPHYPLGSAGGAIAQAFNVGRVRVLMTDLRSMSAQLSDPESPAKTHLGAAQKAWFKQELLSARAAPLTLWVCTHPWIGAAQRGVDNWAGFATERAEIAAFLRDNRINNVVLISGDMHGLAFDTGTHSDYAPGGGAPLPVLHAGSLTHLGGIKGGPYSTEPVLGGQQFGLLEIFDAGGSAVLCRFAGVRVGEGEKMTYLFGSPVAGNADAAFANVSMLVRLQGGDDSVTSGFVVSGEAPRRVLFRAAGPSLVPFGIGDALPSPALTVFQGGRLLGGNDRWGAGPVPAATLRDVFDHSGAFRFLHDDSRDAALLLTLEPGAYTVQVKSADGRPGTTLLEVYHVH